MDELTIDGKIYVSSKRAAAITGYAKDYIGQLCREGRVEAKLVGRSWYVYEPSLKKHRFNDEEEQPEVPKAETAWGSLPTEEPIPAPSSPELSENTSIQAVWDAPTYAAEEVEPLPELEPVVEEPAQEPLTDMQSAWQEWFANRPEEAPVTELVAEEVVEAPRAPEESKEEPKEAPVAEAVPLKVIVSDIQPVREERVVPAAPAVRVAPVASPVRILQRKTVKKGNNRLMEAALILVMVVSASIALISTGAIEMLHVGGTSSVPPIQYLEGSILIER